MQAWLIFLVFGSQAEINRSEDYSIRRFGEVIEAYVKNEAMPPQEELISLRAKLILAERRWSDLKQVPLDSSGEEKKDATRVQVLKAAQAEMNYYQAKISR